MVLIFLSVLLWGLIHSLLASETVKVFARRVAGPVADRIYRLAYNLFAGISLLPVGWLLIVLPDRNIYAVPAPWSYLMLVGQFLAFLALAAGLLQTGVFSFLGLQQLGSPSESSPGLVTTGLYRYVRHPLYTAGLAFIWLSPGMSVNRLALYLSASAYIFIGAYFEERKLRREYGESYAAYASVTPMLVPFLYRNKSGH